MKMHLTLTLVGMVTVVTLVMVLLSRALKRVEAAQENQISFQQSLLDTMPSPVFYKDEACRYLGCNKAFEAFVGYSREELIGKTPHELWPEELADRYRRQDLALLEHPGLQVYETKVRYADGSLRDVIFNKSTFNGRDGAVAGLIGVILDITERKTAEDAVVFQNILLSAQQEASIDGLLVVGENDRILSSNSRFVEVWGIPAHLLEQGEDEPVLRCATSKTADPQQFLAKVRYLNEHPQESSRDEISLADGRTLDRYTVPLLAADGRYCGRLWSFRDITERKVAEDATRSAYQRLQDIVEFLPDPTFVVDKERRVTAWNRAIEQLTGVEKRDILGKGDYVYALPFYGDNRPLLIDLLDREQERLRLNYTEVKQEGQTLFTEVFVPSFRNGESRYFWATATPLFDQEGNQTGAIESIRDITDWKTAEETIKNAYQQLFDIIEFLPDATFVIDLDKKVIAWNRAIEKMTGVEKKEILGHGDYAYSIPFYGERRPILIDLVDADRETLDKYAFVRREGVTVFAETVIPNFHQHGEDCHLWATATPLFDASNKRVGTIESIRDITLIKLAEQKRSRLEAQLQHGRMLETFMVRLSHDLRTPLTPLFVLLPLIKRRVTDSELQDMLDICQKGTAIVKKMVDRAQMLVSLSTRPVAEELELTPLIFAVEGALADNDDSMAHKQVACQIDFDNGLLVSAVPGQLKELFSNLIANAVRFSPDNGVIRITAVQREKIMTVAVHDEGVGLDAKNLERIFDEFFKADESRHDIDAPGLGLSICKRIVLNHKGRIWADSPGIGKGTTITFTLNDTTDDRLI